MKFNKKDQKKLNELHQEELNRVLKRIENGEKTSENYFDAYLMSSMLIYDGSPDEGMVEKYATLAINSSREDIQMNRDVDKAYYQLAQIYYDKKDMKNALLCVSESIELNSEYTPSYFLRKEILIQEEVAKLDYERAKASECVNVVKNLKNPARKKYSKLEYVLLVICIIIVLISEMLDIFC